MSILIKNVLLQQEATDILIEKNIIQAIGKDLPCTAQKMIDGKGKAVIPGLINGHTHAAMTLARGYGDDIPLEQWLYERIWPYEKKLSPDDVYWGAKLACLEMIKSGTTCFNDMYTFFDSTAKAVEEMGLRAVLVSTPYRQRLYVGTMILHRSITCSFIFILPKPKQSITIPYNNSDCRRCVICTRTVCFLRV